MPRKFFLIACEASGDLHTSLLVSEIKKREPDAEFRGLGGPKMAAAGVELLEDMTQISALGFGDVVRQYFTYRKIFYRALEESARWNPDAFILIDSPAFNLRFAKKIRAWDKTKPVIYYVSPQIWAWGARRIHTIKKTVSKMLVILPFEVAIYEKAGVPCEFVGHPLLDEVSLSADRKELRRRFELTDDQLVIGLLPGSRESEVRRILPIMLEAASYLKKDLPQAVFLLGPSANVPRAVYTEILKKRNVGVRFFESHFDDHLACMDFAFITSGTATLEAALVGTPFFLLYKASWSTYFLGKHLIRVPYLGIVNLLLNRSVVPEFIQKDAHAETLAHEAKILLKNPELYQQMKQDFLKVREMLGEKGASRRAARAVLEFVSQRMVERI